MSTTRRPRRLMPDAPATPPALWFIGGPPLGAGVFVDVVARLGRGQLVPLLDADHPTDGWRERGSALERQIREAPGPVVLVAHGLALPAALVAAKAVAGLVLLNGPVTRLDPVTHLVAASCRRAPGVLAGSLLRAGILEGWLASSAGLRRLVSNPYVMDRDTVAALATSTAGSGGLRTASASYLGSLAEGLPDVTPLGCPTRVLWSDEDVLYPSSEADFFSVRAGLGPFTRLAGGRFLAVVERPWEVAERVKQFLSETFRPTATTTSVPRSGDPGRSTGRVKTKK